ncbi:hypothetical protein CPT03_07090 [Pedobacter ginsengisoli]|uniref:RES domain-containing protein n=1 Tax=Pedobacter ginsengisoli TaxID=363852 RepID=A0A2D1U3P6_9SPHI|nr:RES family NAD+ phosphorylase [Pedobacter ginsengisoli]ATP56250.1 hypothetical protein CPT03_07090 [Pedobacter ginsengisoli]
MTLSTDDLKQEQVLACSECFRDQGLKLAAQRCGHPLNVNCPRCGSDSGVTLYKSDLEELSHSFFVNGSRIRTDCGGSVAIKYNEHHNGIGDIDFPEPLAEDAKIIAELLQIGFFLYPPRLWMVGEIEPLKSLQVLEERDSIIQRIIQEFPVTVLTKDTCFYRLRANPANQMNALEYDSAPDEHLAKGRLDSKELPILYGSFDIEACLHECRVTLEQELYLCTMAVAKDLKLLDLTAWITEDVTEFESLSLAIRMLFRAPAHSYEIIRAIALAAKNHGFDGLVYPSYFSQIHASQDVVKNIGLFGRPVKEGTVVSTCINRIVLKKVVYDYHFGPGDF